MAPVNQPVSNGNNLNPAIITNGDGVKLNVGGTVFMTSKGTLTKGDTMLSAMFSGRLPTTEHTDGSVFIDRSGKHFDTILNFLRDGSVPLPETERELSELKIEATYYCIQELVDVCNSRLMKKPLGNEAVVVYEGSSYNYHATKVGNGNNQLHVNGTQIKMGCSVSIPLNQDETMSLAMLQSFFPTAKQLCFCEYMTYWTPGDNSKFRDRYVGYWLNSPREQLLEIEGGVIFPPSEGWKRRKNGKYFVIPFIQHPK